MNALRRIPNTFFASSLICLPFLRCAVATARGPSLILSLSMSFTLSNGLGDKYPKVSIASLIASCSIVSIGNEMSGRDIFGLRRLKRRNGISNILFSMRGEILSKVRL